MEPQENLEIPMPKWSLIFYKLHEKELTAKFIHQMPSMVVLLQKVS